MHLLSRDVRLGLSTVIYFRLGILSNMHSKDRPWMQVTRYKCAILLTFVAASSMTQKRLLWWRPKQEMSKSTDRRRCKQELHGNDSFKCGPKHYLRCRGYTTTVSIVRPEKRTQVVSLCVIVFVSVCVKMCCALSSFFGSCSRWSNPAQHLSAMIFHKVQPRSEIRPSHVSKCLLVWFKTSFCPRHFSKPRFIHCRCRGVTECCAPVNKHQANHNTVSVVAMSPIEMFEKGQIIRKPIY